MFSPAQVDAGDDVRHVFLFGELGGFAVGSSLGQSVHRGTPDIAVIVQIGMQRNEQIAMGRARNVHALAQRNENVAVAGELHAVTAGRFKRFPQAPGDGEHEVLFQQTGLAMRAGIDPAMARIEDDDRLIALCPG